MHRRLENLVIASRKLDAYSEDEVKFLALVADQIALAMDDAINFQVSRRTQERLELLLDLTNRLVSTLDLRDLLRVIAANLRGAMHSDGVAIHLPDAEDGRLRFYALDFPYNNGAIREGWEPAANSTSAQDFRTGEPRTATARDLATDPTTAELELELKSLCHLPLTSRILFWALCGDPEGLSVASRANKGGSASKVPTQLPTHECTFGT